MSAWESKQSQYCIEGLSSLNSKRACNSKCKVLLKIMDIYGRLQELTDTGGFTSILKELKIVTVYITPFTLLACPLAPIPGLISPWLYHSTLQCLSLISFLASLDVGTLWQEPWLGTQRWPVIQGWNKIIDNIDNVLTTVMRMTGTMNAQMKWVSYRNQHLWNIRCIALLSMS